MTSAVVDFNDLTSLYQSILNHNNHPTPIIAQPITILSKLIHTYSYRVVLFSHTLTQIYFYVIIIMPFCYKGPVQIDIPVIYK